MRALWWIRKGYEKNVEVENLLEKKSKSFGMGYRSLIPTEWIVTIGFAFHLTLIINEKYFVSYKIFF
jgi:hypothetical protein